MPAPLPLPALHATHAGIWLAGRGRDSRGEPGRGDRARGRDPAHHPQRAAGRAAARLSRFVGARPARAVRLHPPGTIRGADSRGTVPQRSGSSRLQARPRPQRRSNRSRERLLAVLDDPDWREREGAWTSNATLHRLGWGWAPLIGSRLERPEKRRAHAFLAPEAVGGSGRAAAAADGARRSGGGTKQARPAHRPDRAARRAKGDGRGGDAVFAPKRAKDSPNMLLAEAGTGIGKTLAYLAPASLWAEAVGRNGVGLDLHQGAPAPARRRGAQAVRRRRGAQAQDRHPQGPRELSVPAQPGGCACRARSRAAPRSSPSWSGAGRPTPRTATWSAAICRAGCRACSAAPAPRP